jgi:very-short-patch-repair endonuclease
MEKKMFHSATAPIFERAKELRNHPTDAERILWQYLRTRPGGYKFRRQHPAGNYILDFYSHQLKLAIEADGFIHDKDENRNADMERQTILEGQGIKVVRFTNDEILKHFETVIEQLNLIINECQRKKQ